MGSHLAYPFREDHELIPMRNYLFFVTLFLCCCCSDTQPRLKDTVQKAPRLDRQSALNLERILEESASSIKSMRALASVVAEKSLGREELTQTIVFQRPSRLRMDLLTPGFNQLAGLMLIKDGVVQVLDLQNKTLQVGSADSQVIGSVLKVPVTPDAFMLLLCGQIAPSSFGPKIFTEYLVKSKNLYLLRLVVDDDTEILAEFSLSSPPKRPVFYVVEIRSLKSGKTLSYARFSDPEKIILDDKSAFLPRQVKIEHLSESISIAIDFKTRAINPDTSDERIFSMSVPRNFTVYEIQ